MSDPAAELIRTVIWAVLALAAIQGSLTYLLVRLLTTGHGIFERRERETESKPKIHIMGDR